VTNLVFELQNDKHLREYRVFQHSNIVSLWDMIPFAADFWFVLYRNLAQKVARSESMELMQPSIEKLKGLFEEIGRPFPPPDITDNLPVMTEEAFTQLRQYFEEIEFSCTEMSLGKIIGIIQDGKGQTTFPEIRSAVNEFMTILEYEAKSRLFFMMPPKRAHFYEMSGTFLGQEVLDRFLALRDFDAEGFYEDADEVGNCFATDRYTACVFHLMRVMERCLRKLAKDLGACRATGVI